MFLKAESLMEMLIVLCVFSLLALSSFSLREEGIIVKKAQEIETVAEFVHFHSDALYNRRSMVYYPSAISALYEIRFNKRGNVNMAQSVRISDKVYVIGLGLGRLYEKRTSADAEFDGFMDPFNAD